MGTKNSPGDFDCYAAAKLDEPMFVLLARDPQAPSRVRDWADVREGQVRRGERPSSDMDKVREARECANSMATWRQEHEV